MRKVAGEVHPADLYINYLESKAKVDQLVQLFGGEFRDARPAAAPQLSNDPAAAGNLEVLFREPRPTAGAKHEMTSRPHLTHDERGRRQAL